MKNKQRYLQRATAILLAGLLTVSSVDLSVFTAYASETSVQTDVKETVQETKSTEGESTEEVQVTSSVGYSIAKVTPTVSWTKTSKIVNYTGKVILSEKLPTLTITGINDTNITSEYSNADYTYSYRKSGSGDMFTIGLPIERGIYEIKAAVKEKGNYTEAETTTGLILKIDWLNVSEEASLTDQDGKTLTGDDWWAKEVTFTAPEGFTISDIIDEMYQESFVFTNNGKDTDGSGNPVTYYLKNNEGEVAEKSAIVRVDSTQPWISSVLTDSKDVTATVTVTATDTGSGVDTYYLLCSKRSLDSWTEEDIIEYSSTQSNTTGEFSLMDLSCATTYYYAVVVKDKAGNIFHLYSDFETEKINPVFDVSDIPIISGTYGQSLSEMTLSKTTDTSKNGITGTWKITEANADSIYPTVNGTTKYEVTFTPTDESMFETCKAEATTSVMKATPYIEIVPRANAITYGQMLGSSNLTNGKVQYSASNIQTVAGSFVWKDGNIKPTAKDDSNTTSYTVIFKPTDSDNYNEVETEITITVNKVQYAPNMPGSTRSVSNSITKVGDVTLPSGWVWDESDKDTPLEVDVEESATALYEGADKGNYENESVNITITRSACEHVLGEILYTGTGEHAPNCVNDGLGHTECTKCHVVTESSFVVAALGHQGGIATCKKKAVCTVCHQEYGSTNPAVHTVTEVKGHKNADCTSAGYTGDTHCADCGTKLKSGTVVAALGHDYKSEVTTEPTTTSTGVRTYTCKRCGYSYTETIAKLPEETHNHSYTGTVTRQADCTNAGVKTYTCSCGDSYTESIPALGHHYISKVTKQATTTEEGIMTYTCDRCGHSYTRPIAKLANSGDKPGNDNKPAENDKPGENNKPAENNKQGENNKPDNNSKPDTGKPYIEGKSDQNGWENIKDQLNEAKTTTGVTVAMNGTSVVPGTVLDTIKGKDVSVVFDLGEGITWTVNGKDITAEQVGDIDFGVTVGAQAGNTIPADIINEVVGERYSVNVSLAYDGEFGFTAILTVNVDKANVGRFANLFYYNPESGALEYVCASQIDADGNANLEFTHASDYVVVVDAEDMQATETDRGEDISATPDEVISADTDVNVAWNPLWILLIGAIVVIAGLGIFFVTKKKETEK